MFQKQIENTVETLTDLLKLIVRSISISLRSKRKHKLVIRREKKRDKMIQERIQIYVEMDKPQPKTEE